MKRLFPLLWALSLPASAAQFSDVLPGSRPQGMGMAYTAVSDDPYGMYYNPAGLAGSDFPQLGGTVGRMISPDGLLSFEAITYTRPLPFRPGATVGTSFFGLKQDAGAGNRRDQLLFHLSESYRIPQLYLNKPLQVGANAKFVSMKSKNGKKFGIGVDGGALIDSGMGLKFGLSVTDLTTELGVPRPTLALGSSYRWRDWVLFASDLRIRPGLTELYPGVEFDLYQKLLKLRVGKGIPLEGISQVAFGFGANFSPVVLDFGATVPFKGINRVGGAYQVTVNYKFGAPVFYGRFVGAAARQAEDLRSEIEAFEEKRKLLRGQVVAAESDKTALEGQVEVLEKRQADLQRNLRSLEERRARELYDEAHRTPPPQPVQEPAPKPRPKTEPAKAAAPKSYTFPHSHVVAPGDTLRGLARTYYDDASLWEIIYEANADKVERGLPVEGKVLTIPAPRVR